jgi:DUF4097 and DUF4098 domain-containing protein YvlB
MTTAEERVQILKMVEARKITPEEAAKLLETLEHASQQEEVRDKGKSAHWFRVKVTDLHTGKAKVNVSIPMGLVNVGLRMGAKFAPDLDSSVIQEVLDAAKSGQRGRIIEVEDEESGEHVEIYAE